MAFPQDFRQNNQHPRDVFNRTPLQKNTATTSSNATAPSTSALSPPPTQPHPTTGQHGKENANLIVVDFHAMMTTFTAAAIIPVYSSIALDFSTSIHLASYLTSLQILVLGWAPLF
ncbi:hypothetical protein TI39_contig5887g00007 [Zymoseptoria brevis]|uniref:Uncharacterized protein n=1 Tax=Zymoseptoria brevis TaxID=1047168 RepID=A0A0F4G585_9PEZI|nr:hypothetical protein TI39_contig5887g00007 [Zymoseptoria brevis]